MPPNPIRLMELLLAVAERPDVVAVRAQLVAYLKPHDAPERSYGGYWSSHGLHWCGSWTPAAQAWQKCILSAAAAVPLAEMDVDWVTVPGHFNSDAFWQRHLSR